MNYLSTYFGTFMEKAYLCHHYEAYYIIYNV